MRLPFTEHIRFDDSVRFSDLLDIDFEPTSRVIRMASLRPLLPNTPEEVMVQVYADHGRRAEYQEQYGHIEISALQWEKIAVTAEVLARFSCYHGFRRFIDIRRAFADEFAEKGWQSVDGRPAVVAHWEKHKTWITPPVFLSGHLVNQDSLYHLVEGHTRTAILMGSLEQGLVDSKSKHQIWLGYL